MEKLQQKAIWINYTTPDYNKTECGRQHNLGSAFTTLEKHNSGALFRNYDDFEKSRPLGYWSSHSPSGVCKIKQDFQVFRLHRHSSTLSGYSGHGSCGDGSYLNYNSIQLHGILTVCYGETLWNRYRRTTLAFAGSVAYGNQWWLKATGLLAANGTAFILSTESLCNLDLRSRSRNASDTLMSHSIFGFFLQFCNLWRMVKWVFSSPHINIKCYDNVR